MLLVCVFIVACQQENHKAVVPKASGKAIPADTTPAYGDVLVLSSIGDASTLIPMLASDASSHEVAGFLFNGLVKYDKDYNIVGDLARSWDIENGGKLLRFHLRNDVLWHDGAKFTARDVMFTYNLIIDPKTPTAYAEKYKLVKRARILDEYTFEVEYDKPLAPALISWGSLQVLPEHILKGVDITKTPFARAPVGTGPFAFVSWQTGQKITLKANEKYFDGMPFFTGINYRIITDQNTEFLELKSGSLDMMGLTPLQYLRQTETPEFKKMFAKYKFLSDGYTYLGFNLKKKPFDDKLVRQAISYAIDRDEIIKGVLNGLGEPTTGPYKPGTKWYNANVTKYPYSPDKSQGAADEGRLPRQERGRHRGKGRQRPHHHHPHQPGQPAAREDRPDRPATAQAGRNCRKDPYHRVDRVPEGIRGQGQLRRRDPRLEHPAGP